MRNRSLLKMTTGTLIVCLHVTAGCSGAKVTTPSTQVSTTSTTTTAEVAAVQPDPDAPKPLTVETTPAATAESLARIRRSEEEWRKQLTAEQFYVTRQQGTERSFTGDYWDNKKEGVYDCVCCGLPLFGSETKFKSGTGWPSFWQPIKKRHIAEEEDAGFFGVRVEVKCVRCDAHLGHVFDDGPAPTGLRYCINSAALKFDEAKAKAAQDAKVKGSGAEAK